MQTGCSVQHRLWCESLKHICVFVSEGVVLTLHCSTLICTHPYGGICIHYFSTYTDLDPGLLGNRVVSHLLQFWPLTVTVRQFTTASKVPPWNTEPSIPAMRCCVTSGLSTPPVRKSYVHESNHVFQVVIAQEPLKMAGQECTSAGNRFIQKKQIMVINGYEIATFI